MKIILIICVHILLLGSCVFIRMDDSIDLGDKFRYIQDYPQTIVYHESEEYKGTGIIVVEPLVTAYSFNDRYIIARSQKEEIIKEHDSLKAPIQYWIIDKKERLNLAQPLDSSTFYIRLKALSIELAFREK